MTPLEKAVLLPGCCRAHVARLAAQPREPPARASPVPVPGGSGPSAGDVLSPCPSVFRGGASLLPGEHGSLKRENGSPKSASAASGAVAGRDGGWRGKVTRTTGSTACVGGRVLSRLGSWDLAGARPLPLKLPRARPDTLPVASPLLALAARWPSALVSLPGGCLMTLSPSRPRRCLTLEGTARRSAAAGAAIMSATEVASTRGGGRGRDRAAASVTVGTAGKTVTTFGPGGESAQARPDLGPRGGSPARPEATVVRAASGWPGPCSRACSELRLPRCRS